MTDSTETSPSPPGLSLPPTLSLAEVAGLHRDITARRGQDVNLDAEGVRHLGAQCLAVLLAAQKAWQEDGRAFVVENPSEEFEFGLTQMGVPPNQFLVSGENS